MANPTALADLVNRWHELHQQGQSLSPDKLCADCPEMLDELNRHLRAVAQMESFLRVVGGDTSGHSQTPASASDAVPVPAADAIPGYQILGVLGRGGMGVVYQARDLRLGRDVALKMILTGTHTGPGGLDRFRSEAQAVARLQHPNIVQIFEVGEHDRVPYLSLEYV